ncbi:MAG: hypothetical protein GXP35_05420 [Actinobacteria bacterium]|nr:hypothetical protein [Actinomycetota bacterium]
MGKYWLLDRHGADGPSILVETDGGMRVVDVMRFGPGVTELKDQQGIWDDVAGRLAPTLKPFVPATKLEEVGSEVHKDLRYSTRGEILGKGHGSGWSGSSGGRAAAGAKRTGGRGRG